jgi:excisionase family DNA binding protein
MLSLGIRFIVQGKEVSVDSFVEAVMQQVRSSVREEISRTLTSQLSPSREWTPAPIHEMTRQVVSIREAARLLSLSPRTIHKYVASKTIRTVRVGRRVLVPMKSVNEIATKGIPSRRNENTADGQ